MTDSYSEIAQAVDPYEIGARTRSAAALAWFFEAVWRLDPSQVEDSICDGSGDKGIDGIVIDDDATEITVFQIKHMISKTKTQGDKDLKNFFGVAPYFSSVAGLDSLLASKPRDELRRLIERLDVREKLDENNYGLNLVYVTNAVADKAATDYIATISGSEHPIDLWDQHRLHGPARRTEGPQLLPDKVTLIAKAVPTELQLTPDLSMAIGVVPASELISKLPGIDDFSVFGPNVRLSAGGTRINKELTATVEDQAEHSLFPAYHNGLTLLTEKLEVIRRSHKLKLNGVAVVNGCQSLLALNSHASDLSDDLAVMVKIVEVGVGSGLESKITYRANNQNPVNMRDQRSTDKAQIDLQRQVQNAYGKSFFYGIRQGEEIPAKAQVLDNRDAAQLIMAMWLEDPAAAVRRVRLFDKDYHRIFSRAVDAHRLRIAFVVDQLVSSSRAQLPAELISSFSSVRLTLAYLTSAILNVWPLGAQLMESPGRWLPESEDAVRTELGKYARQASRAVASYVEQQRANAESRGDTFDPKTVFKSKAGVLELTAQVTQAADAIASQMEAEGQHYEFRTPPIRPS